MPPKTVKVAVSLPLHAYRQIEKVRKRLRASRSAVIGEALECWLSKGAADEKIRIYVEGYRRFPESVAEKRLFESLASEVLGEEEWLE